MGKDPSWRPHLMVTASSMPSPKPYMEMRPWHFLWSWVQSYQLQSVINQICNFIHLLFAWHHYAPAFHLTLTFKGFIQGKGAFSVCFVRPSVILSFRPSVASKFVFSTPPTSLHGFEWNLAGMLHHKSRSACGEIIHVRQILAELWSLTLRIFTYFSLSSQLLLHPCMDLNETWQGCCTTSLQMHVGR